MLAFEVDTTGAATLNAGWGLRDPKSHQVWYDGQSAIVEPAGGIPGEAKGDAAVAALSRALARLSRELAVAIVTDTEPLGAPEVSPRDGRSSARSSLNAPGQR